MPFTTALVMGGLGALQGSIQANAQKNAQKRQADLAAAQTQYSPWTGISPQQFQPQAVDATGSMLTGALGGGLAGYMAGRNKSQAPETPAPAEAPQTSQSPWGNMGGQQYAQMLNAQGNQFEQEMMKKNPTIYGR